MYQNILSTAEQVGNVIDGRELTLAIEFYRLSQTQVKAFCEDALCWLEELTDNGFVRKRFDSSNKSTTQQKALMELQRRIHAGLYWSYGMEGFVYSPVVYNIKSMNQYRRRAVEILHEKKLDWTSVDYVAYWDELFPEGRPDDDQIKQNIVRLFNEEKRKAMTGFGMPDVHASISICSYESNPGLYWGYFRVRFSAYSLNRYVNEVARRFVEFGLHMSETYINVNARVQLQPPVIGYSCSHMRYFGTDGRVDQSHVKEKCMAAEWYPTYYLPGVEWMNIISPLVRKHIPDVNGQNAHSKDVTISELNGGGLLIGSTKEIDQYQIVDARMLKHLLYPALYPGSSYITLSKLFRPKEQRGKLHLMTFPRNNWAIVPMFEEEIKIVSTYLVFSWVDCGQRT
ncbi:MAG: hypothetical protein IJZ85_10945 [Lachnospiraceae bacterium]|nr:hypothetical protein [Lachnospiraceae bacterium]